MDKKTKIVIVFVVLIALALMGFAVWWFFIRKEKKEETKDTPVYDIKVPAPGIPYQLSNFTVGEYVVDSENSPYEDAVTVKTKVETDVKAAFDFRPVSVAGVKSPWQITRYKSSKIFTIWRDTNISPQSGYYVGRVLYPGGTKIPTKLPIPNFKFTVNRILRTEVSSTTYILNQTFKSATQFFPIGREIKGKINGASDVDLTVVGIDRGELGEAVVAVAPAQSGVVSFAF